MPPSFVLALRWLLTAISLVLVVLIVLHMLPTEEATDPAVLINADPLPTVLDQQTAVPVNIAPPSATATTPPQIAVDVIGAVVQPGLYWLASPARIDDVIRAAGGFTPDVDREQINLAAPVEDGQQIRVPFVGELAAASPAPSAAEPAAQAGPIDLNRADVETLNQLPGIGPATAQAIVEYRAANGPFTRIEQVEDVKGVGPALFNKIKAQIVVDP